MPTITLFSSVKDVNNPEHLDLFDYLEGIRDGAWRELVSQCRSISDKDERNLFKRSKMPTVCMSGEFSYRNDVSLVNHNSYICIEFDNCDNPNDVKRVLCKDKYVMAAWLSPSGTGLRSLWKIHAEKHREAFLGISKYLFDEYELVCETDGINVSKPYIVSDDAGAWINYDTIPFFKKYVKEAVVKPVASVFHTASDFEMVYKQIIGRRINICEDYSNWRKVGFALAEQFQEDGRTYFHELSAIGKDYKQSLCDKQYTAFLRARGSVKANIATFYYLAKEQGVSIISEQTKVIVRQTKNGKVAGLSKEQIKENLKKFNNIEGADKLVEEVFESDMKEERDQASIIHQVELYITNNYSLKMNEVTGYLEQACKPLTPADLNTMFIATKKMVANLDYQLMIRLLKSDFIESYNPFFQFLKSDGIPVLLPANPIKDQNSKYESPLIDTLARSVVNDDPKFTQYFLRKWFVSIISSMHKIHSPLLLALLGKQNSGKTEFFRRLLPHELHGYYAESKLDKEKDDELLMCENILIVDDELGGKSKQDSLKLKNITSKQYFSLRRPYGDHNEKILRLAVLGGTSNVLNVFYDDTGNRRVIPIIVKDIDKELYNSINKKDLLFEAFNLYKAGFDWRVTQYDIDYLNQDKDRYENPIKERELVEKYYTPGADFFMSTTDIAVELERLTNQRLSLNILGRQMDVLGFGKKPVKAEGNTRKWLVTKIGREGQAVPDGQHPMDIEKF